MKKYAMLIGLAAVVTVVSCNRENLVPEAPVPSKGTVITLTTDATKTTVGELADGKRAVYWANGDKINVNGVESEALAGLEEGSRSASFNFGSVLSAPYTAVYPASIWKDATTVTLPAVAESGILPLYGTGDENVISVSALTAVLKLSIKKYSGENPDTDKIVSVEVSSETAQLSGDFGFSTGTLTPDTGEKTVRVEKAFTPSETAYDLYIPVPAGEYAFKVKITDLQGHYMEIPTTSAKTFTAGEIKAMPVIEFLPTGTQIDIEIHNAEEMIAFATAYNAGEYERPVAKVVNDITFDASSSAAYAATGGVGTADDGNGGTLYFNGTFDGGGFTFKGYTGNVPLFAYTGSDGIIKDLTLDGSCSYTVPSGADGQFGILVGRNKGSIRDCSSAASMVIKNIDATSRQYYGGLVGRNYGGDLEHCSVSGDITVDAGTAGDGYIMALGGVSGTLEDGGSVSDSYFGGSIQIGESGGAEGLINLSRYLYIGGIAGTAADQSTITGCETLEGSAIAISSGSKIACGGIYGYSANDSEGRVSSCVNRAPITLHSSYGEDSAYRGATTPIYIGGIAGQTSFDMMDCTNYAPIETVSMGTTLSIGGIAAVYGGSMQGCINETGGTITRSCATANRQSNRYNTLGGIIGATADVEKVTLSECINKANITHNTPGAQALTTQRIGGIAGGNDNNKLEIVRCDNSGDLLADDNVNKIAYYLTAMGGILGGSKGAVSIVNSNNSGLVKCDYHLGGTSNRNSFIGGILGLVAKYDSAKGKDGLVNVGGVADVSIADCTNSGEVNCYNYNNTVTLVGGPFHGGIAAAIIGTADSKAAISGCKVTAVKLYEGRGFLGGIAGYVEQVDITDCESSAKMTSSNANSIAQGGLACWMVASSLVDCTTSSALGAVKNIGGFAYLMDGTSTITGCKASGISITKGTNAAATDPGVFVWKAESGAKITDCGASGTINGAAITTGSTFISVDEGATIVGTYLLD